LIPILFDILKIFPGTSRINLAGAVAKKIFFNYTPLSGKSKNIFFTS